VVVPSSSSSGRAHLLSSTQLRSWSMEGLLHLLLAASWHMVVPPHLLMWWKLTARPFARFVWCR
jgi:hypothetical protein